MATFTQADIDKMIAALSGRQSQAFNDLSGALAKAGISVASGIVSAGQAVFQEGLKQAQQYQDEIVAEYGDFTLQQEKYGASAAKLTHMQTDALRQNFMTLEEGGVKLVDTFKDINEAAGHANEIIGNFHGSARQFTEDLQGQNLVVTQLLSKAAGLTSDQTANIMKLAKARGEDSKQMLADIGVFSKAVADKFGLDTKMVADEVVNITEDVSTFGKASVEAATAAAAKMQAFGLSVDEVKGSLVSSFGSFDSAASSAAQLSQALGVNIDAMQMMVDMNSGPEGVTRGIDALRESVIGAGIDVSELSAPLIRTFKQITGIADDKTLFAMFDPERMGIDTDEIMDTAQKAADAQLAPAEAIKLLDNDISKVYRSLEEMKNIVGEQQLSRLGREAAGAAVDFSKLTAQSGQFTNNLNASLEQIGALKDAVGAVSKGARDYAAVATEGAKFANQLVINESNAAGKDITRPEPANIQGMINTATTAGVSAAYQGMTGYTPTDALLQSAASQDELAAAIKAFLAPANAPDVTPDQRSAAAGVIASKLGVDPTKVTSSGQLIPDLSTLFAGAQQVPGSTAAATATPASPPAPPAAATASPAPAATGPATPPIGASATPASPTSPLNAVTSAISSALGSVIGTANAAPIPVTAPQTLPTAAAAPSAQRATAVTSVPGAGTATLASTSASPIQLNLTISLDSKQLASSVASTGQFLLQRAP